MGCYFCLWVILSQYIIVDIKSYYMLPIDKAVASRGMQFIKDGTYEGRVLGFIPVEGVVMPTEIKNNGLAVDLSIYGMTAAILPTGMPLGISFFFSNAENITSITVTGTVVIIKG